MKLSIYQVLSLFLLAVLCMVGVSACVEETPEEKLLAEKEMPIEEPDQIKPVEQPIKIGFSMDTLLEERWLKDRDLFKESVEELGAEVEILAANGNDAL